MRVHHLNAALMRPPLVGALVAHVLLVESPDGLVLVDSGFGRDDLADWERLGPMRHVLRADRTGEHTAVAGVERLGFDPGDVRHIVLTHMDLDHVGGVADFPAAAVHTTALEWRAATSDSKMMDRPRYFPAQWASKADDFQPHDGPGEAWRHGLSGHRIVDGVTLIPMTGHTRGHAAVAVEGDDGLIVHAGDAAFDGSTIGAELPPMWVLRGFERTIARQPMKISANHRILRELNAAPDVTVITAHDPRLFPGDVS